MTIGIEKSFNNTDFPALICFGSQAAKCLRYQLMTKTNTDKFLLVAVTLLDELTQRLDPGNLVINTSFAPRNKISILLINTLR